MSADIGCETAEDPEGKESSVPPLWSAEQQKEETNYKSTKAHFKKKPILC